MIRDDDKRAVEGSKLSLKGNRYCKYCYDDTANFLLIELDGDDVSQILRCCNDCGAGLEIVFDAD